MFVKVAIPLFADCLLLITPCFYKSLTVSIFVRNCLFENPSNDSFIYLLLEFGTSIVQWIGFLYLGIS